MNQTEPSLAEWKDLYQAADSFGRIECWNWMEDSQLFGVEHPGSVDTGYCCVLGAIGQAYGLAVYLGSDGLDTYLKIQSGEVGPGDLAVMHLQRCFSVLFETKRGLEAEELGLLKELRLEFKGRHSWPVIRSHVPGYLPWFLNRQEALFLTDVLKQAREVALRVREDEAVLLGPPGKYLIRHASTKGSETVWEDVWREPMPSVAAKSEQLPIDKLRLRKINSKKMVRAGVWELVFTYAPFPVGEGGRPYFPYLLLCVDRDSGLVLHVGCFDHKNALAQFQEALLSLFEKSGRLPRQISVNEKKLFDLLDPLAGKLGLELALVDEFDALTEAFDSMLGYFSRRG